MATDTAPALQRPDAPPAPAPDIRGLVDNATPDRLYGWAWNAAAPAERVAIEARLGATTVHATRADLARPDLAKAGVGDGCHAFEIPLEPEWIRRRSELSIVARSADGTETPVPVRVRRATGDADDAGLPRMLDAIVAGQRRLHEDLRAIAARLPDPGGQTALASLVQSHRDLQERLDVLALWLTRLDERLATLPVATEPAPVRGSGWTILLGGVLGTLGAAALLLAMRLGG
ncbi:hypothetical protein [Roseomonas fluvialis]|uniref:Membrane-anchored protein n=1 Tax=Roseomonas fluvialis TaxID=1750527 RepID=A0ABN6P0Q4_9PROT|nr:hypothetical protein [Roseomonas fluvialis]BDG71946.1 hypothetical protein Rmf_18750 [Roseomonas fluvialis]